MIQKKFHATEALSNNQDAVHQMMEGGSYTGMEELFTTELLKPVAYRSRVFYFVTVERCQKGDMPPGSQSPGALFFTPSISFMLRANVTDRGGLVSQISYADFQLPPTEFDSPHPSPLPIGRFLSPEDFSVHYGENYMAPRRANEIYVYPFGGHEEWSLHARLVGETINATSEVVRTLGFEALFAEQQQQVGNRGGGG